MGRGSWAVTPLRQAEGAQVGILLIVESPKDEALLSRFQATIDHYQLLIRVRTTNQRELDK
jgi:hypothetical protein